MKKALAIAIIILIVSVVTGWYFYNQSTQEVSIEEDIEEESSLATYTNSQYGFTMDYPNKLSVQSFDTDSGEIIAFIDAENPEIGFQITISAYAGSGVLNKESIEADLPGIVIENPSEIAFGDYYRALTFTGDSSEIGATKEAWFLYEGNLYQIVTFDYLYNWIGPILDSWDFINTR